MTFESIERIRFFVGATRTKLLVSAQSARLNGYKQVALDHQNEAQLAALILMDLANETGEVCARQKADY